MGGTMPYRDAELQKRYKQALADWRQHINRREIQEQSNTDYYIDNAPFRKIIAFGTDALPLLMEDIAGGEFFLNYAVQSITRVDVKALYPNETVIGAQDRSRLWLRWWAEEGKKQYQKQ